MIDGSRAHGGFDVGAELLAQRVTNVLFERRVSGDRGDDLSTHDAGSLVGQRVVVGEHLADDPDTAPLDEQPREVARLSAKRP